jgi:hypothetical protein
MRKRYTTNDILLRDALRNWVNVGDWANPVAVTLSFKQGVRHERDGQPFWVQLDRASAAQNFRHFMNLLNRSVFGKATERYGVRLKCFAVTEGGADALRLHYHAVLERPDRISFDDFVITINDIWRSTDWGYNNTTIVSNADGGWIDYITKLKSKPDYIESLDCLNTHI